jgi:hypothetical protein
LEHVQASAHGAVEEIYVGSILLGQAVLVTLACFGWSQQSAIAIAISVSLKKGWTGLAVRQSAKQGGLGC